MKWHADIVAVDNGFIVEYCDGEGKRKVVYQMSIAEEFSSVETDKSHIVNMFYDILEHFGEQGSKHDKKRIKITYDKQ